MGEPRGTLSASVLLVLGIVTWNACSAPAGGPGAGAPAARPAAGAATQPASASTATVPAGAVAPPKPGQPHSFQLGVVALAAYFYPMWVAVDKGLIEEQ